MKILFDQNMPEGLRKHLTDHEVHTAAEMGWSELVNGHLLQAAEDQDFDLLVTADKNMQKQQNLARRKIGFVILGTNHWPSIKASLDLVCMAVNNALPGTYAEVPIAAVPNVRSLRRRR